MTGSRRCLYYAFGGGLGHGMRTLALARQCVRQMQGEHLVLLNSPFAAALDRVIAQEPNVQAQFLPASAGPAEAGHFLTRILNNFQPDVMIVDTFPRGLGGEFVSLFAQGIPSKRILISRSLPPAYVENYALVDFAREYYDLILAPGEPSPFEPFLPVLRTERFLIRDYEELPSATQAAALVHTSPEEPIILVVGSGTVKECWEMAYLAAELQAEYAHARLALPCPLDGLPPKPLLVTHVPLLECMPAVRLAIGGGGYNLVAECSALEVPALFLPRERQYDNQANRIAANQLLQAGSNLRAEVGRKLQDQPAKPTTYRNGAATAAHLIANMR